MTAGHRHRINGRLVAATCQVQTYQAIDYLANGISAIHIDRNTTGKFSVSGVSEDSDEVVIVYQDGAIESAYKLDTSTSKPIA